MKTHSSRTMSLAMETKERFTKQDLRETRTWLESEGQAKVPPQVHVVLLMVLSLVEKIEPLTRRSKRLLELLLQSWDLVPASEKSARAKADAPGREGKAGAHRRRLTKGGKRKTSRSGKRKSEGQHPAGSALPVQEEEATRSTPHEESLEREGGADMSDVVYGSETHTLYDLEMFWKKRTIHAETKTNLKTGKTVRAAIPEAPPGGKFTYKTMVNLAILHVGYQMPLARIERWLSNSAVSLGRSTIYGFLVQIATVFLPIFHVLCELLAKNARVIEEDDFNTRINKKGASLEALRTKPRSTDGEKLLLALEDSIGLSAVTVDGKRPKTKANLTVLSGLISETEPNSRIVLKLTHLGGAGDLCGRLVVKYRDSKNPLWLVSDLSSANTLRAKGIERFTIHQQGCIWHARRRFWRVRECDDECFHALRCLKGIAAVEERIADTEATPDEVTRLRKRYSTWFFKRLIKICAALLKTWGKESAVGEAAEYVLANEHTLRQFLKYPFLVPHNNRVERYGRPEKLMLSASKFRDTLAGRVVYDIIASLMATCCANNIDFFAYTLDVMLNRDAVRRDPAQWTPFAWSKRQQAIQK